MYEDLDENQPFVKATMLSALTLNKAKTDLDSLCHSTTPP